MQSQEEKLSLFLKAISDYAEQQRMRILSDMDKQSTVELEAAEKEALSDAYRMIQRETVEVRESISREMAARELQGRRRLFECRAALEDKVFEEAAEKLRRFTKGEGYGGYMARAAAAAKRVFASAPESTVFYIREQDDALEPVIRQSFGSKCAVQHDPLIELGGLRAANSALGRGLDVTLDSRLQEQREWFCTNADMSIGSKAE